MDKKSESFSQSKTLLPMHFLEPTNDLTRKHFVNAKLGKLKKNYQEIDMEEIKKKLKSIREDNIADLIKNSKHFQFLIQEKGIDTYYAKTAKDAARQIEDIMHKSKLDTICINNSTTVQEALSEIHEKIKIVDTYNANYKDPEDTYPLNYWELPIISDNRLWKSFKEKGMKYKESYDFCAFVGVNSVSLKDGNFFFIQHFKNISEMIKTAKEVILIISIEKIAKDFEQALFISKSAAFFGLKSVLLGVLTNETKYQKISTDQITSIFKKGKDNDIKNFHVIILDNGRTSLLGGENEEFLQCINCQACGAVCPRSLVGQDREYRTPRDIVHLSFFGDIKEAFSNGLYNCSLCGSCEITCPLSIPLPDYLRKIREQSVKEGLVQKKHLTMMENVKDFGNPYGKGD